MFRKAASIAVGTLFFLGQAALASPAHAAAGEAPATITVKTDKGTSFAHGSWYCNGQLATILGTDDAEMISGTDGDDVIVSLNGHDSIGAGAGDDVICAGDGVDDVFGGDGNDMIWGEDDNDSLEGNGGDDIIYLGGATLPYNGPAEWLPANYGMLAKGNIACGDCTWNNPAYGTAGNDVIYGGSGPDVGIAGRGGDDTIILGGGNDSAYGEAGMDRIDGGSGKDLCNAEDRSGSCETR